MLSQRTRHIRLGTGVSSLPYHHPLILADRMVLLDHLTRGRAMFGVGPGALPSDAFMMGIDPARPAGHDGGIARGHPGPAHHCEPVNMKRTGLPCAMPGSSCGPYTHPRFEVAVAAQVSPGGAPGGRTIRAVGLLSIGATTAGGFDVLGTHWQTMEERAAEFGTTVDRRHWRLVGPMHIAETEEQARE